MGENSSGVLAAFLEGFDGTHGFGRAGFDGLLQYDVWPDVDLQQVLSYRRIVDIALAERLGPDVVLRLTKMQLGDS